MWVLWAVSVVAGSLAVAVSMFVLTHRQYALYEATHENLLTFMVSALPHIWIAVFVLMVSATVYNLRHTKCGYRYSMMTVVLSSMVFSLVGGIGLQYYGIGYTIDDMLGRSAEMYLSQEKLEQKQWQSPEEGRLLGRQTRGEVLLAKTITFEDSAGEDWQVDVSELPSRDLELLATERAVRMIGKTKDSEHRLFHSCGAFLWLADKDSTLSEKRTARREFIDRIDSYTEKEEARLRLIESGEEPATPTQLRSICDGIVPVGRMLAH